MKAKETTNDTGHGEAGTKLPKEVLSNGFWDALGNEGGDSMWRTSRLIQIPQDTQLNNGFNVFSQR